MQLLATPRTPHVPHQPSVDAEIYPMGQPSFLGCDPGNPSGFTASDVAQALARIASSGGALASFVESKPGIHPSSASAPPRWTSLARQSLLAAHLCWSDVQRGESSDVPPQEVLYILMASAMRAIYGTPDLGACPEVEQIMQRRIAESGISPWPALVSTHFVSGGPVRPGDMLTGEPWVEPAWVRDYMDAAHRRLLHAQDDMPVLRFHAQIALDAGNWLTLFHAAASGRATFGTACRNVTHVPSDSIHWDAQAWRDILSDWRRRIASPDWVPDPITAAIGASRICRYTGRIPYPVPGAARPVPFFHSVADHQRLVAWILQRDGYSADAQLHGLVHDAHEAWFMDISTPIKAWLGPEVKRIEDAIEEKTLRNLGHPDMCIDNATQGDLIGPIGRADQIALISEAVAMGMPMHVFGSLAGKWAHTLVSPDALRDLHMMQPGEEGDRDHAQSAARWLAEWSRLRRECGQSSETMECLPQDFSANPN